MAFFKYRVQTLPHLRNKGYLHRDEQRDLEAAYEFLLRTRNELHYLTNRPGDTIHLGLQPKIATALKYRQRDVLRRMEAFMRDYYTHARNIFLITNALAERMALTPQRVSALQKLLGRRRRRKPEEWDGFIVERGVISPATARTFKDDPLRILRVFLHTQRQHLEFSPDLRTRLRQDLDLVNRSFRTSREARDMFFEILRRKGQVARILRLMHETGVLGQYLPEFGKLTCLVQHEFFHRYTADEHTLQVIDHLDRVLDATQPPHSNYRKIFQAAEHPGILYLALLLHDVGKAANAERHAEASVEGARKVAARLHLDQDETERLLFLVRDHLKLSLLSQRRDIDDQATIAAAARVVKNPANLDLLQLLTFADAAGTSLKGWSDWKEALLWELYHRTRQALTGPERARNILAKRIEQLYREVSTKLKNKLPLEEIYSHFELMSASYYINTSATLIINHLNLIHEFITRQQEVEKAEDSLAPVIEWRSQESQGFSQVDICTWDRLGLFSKICASFAVAGLNILRARVYTRSDHVVLDVFEVCDRDHQAVHDPKAIQTAESMLTRILTLQQEVDYDKITERLRARRRSRSRLQEMTIPTVIQFDNEISESRTVIEVQAEDQVGLLYTLTDTMSHLGLDISIAKIATEKGAAFDSFYVMDHFTGKVTDNERLDQIRHRLEDAIAALGRQG